MNISSILVKSFNFFAIIFLLSACLTTNAEHNDSDPLSVLGGPAEERAFYNSYNINTVGEVKAVMQEMVDSGYLSGAEGANSYKITFRYLVDRETAKNNPGKTALDIRLEREEANLILQARKQMTIQEAAPNDGFAILDYCTGYLVHAHSVMRDEGPNLNLNSSDQYAYNEFVEHLDLNSSMFVLSKVQRTRTLSDSEQDLSIALTREGVEFARLKIEKDSMRIITPGNVKNDVMFCLNQAQNAKAYIN
ncbi:hypothetical protein N8860_09125 [Alphaproteobacteria bacterium]|nr:hypothetical protein [Alphaproteobacteria bacterium]